ncbi:MAG: hypothetical protein HEQ35_07535 [Gloeotrichia echinulata IR180]|jgi:hypothetical protein
MRPFNYDPAPGKTSIYGSVVASATATALEIAKNSDTAIARTAKVAITQQPHLVELERGGLLAKIVIWAWIGKIEEVAHAQRNNIKTLMARMIVTVNSRSAIAVLEAQAARQQLVKVGCFLKELQKLLINLEFCVYRC